MPQVLGPNAALGGLSARADTYNCTAAHAYTHTYTQHTRTHTYTQDGTRATVVSANIPVGFGPVAFVHKIDQVNVCVYLRVSVLLNKTN